MNNNIVPYDKELVSAAKLIFRLWVKYFENSLK